MNPISNQRQFHKPVFQRKLPTTALVGLTLLALIFAGSFLTQSTVAEATNNDNGNNNMNCSTIELVSGTNTKTAGWTSTNPTSSPLNNSNYDNGSLSTASVISQNDSAWINPMTDDHFENTSAKWVSTDTSWPGGSGNQEGTSMENQWRLYEDSFTLPTGATVTSADVWYTADNAVAVYLNDNQTAIDSTNNGNDEVYGTTPTNGNDNHGEVFNTSFTPVSGLNTVNFVTRNWSTNSASNPTGLIYHISVDYCLPGNDNDNDDVQVHIVKYIDGRMATSQTADGHAFPMTATWRTDNTGARTGNYTLNPNGSGGTSSAYHAMSSEMSYGASYSTRETTTGNYVGVNCSSNKPYALKGYTSGNTLAQAASQTPTSIAPTFSRLTSDKYIIVWNEDCENDDNDNDNDEGTLEGDVNGGNNNDNGLVVTSIERIRTEGTADNSFQNGWKYIFHITTPMNEPKLAMKFSDWMMNSTSNNNNGTLPVANNMRISSMEADNNGAYVLLTSANMYSTPALTLDTDLDLTMPGRQVEVTVEIKIPTNTMNGTYTTNYGVQTLN